MIKRLSTLCLILTIGTALHAQDKETFLTDCERSGFIQTPRYNETIAYCQKLADASPMIHYTTFGKSPEGRDLPVMIIDKDGDTTPEAIRRKGHTIMLIQACIHAGEPDGKDAGLMLIRDMTIHKKHLELLDNISLVFIPIFNVDGHENFGAKNRINQNGPEELGTRTTAQLINMNRDFLKADAPEMRSWLRLFNLWLPEVFIDIHVTNGADFQYVMTYNMETNSTYMEKGLRQWATGVYEKALSEKMEAGGYPIFPYFHFLQSNTPESGMEMEIFDPRYSQAYAAARNRIGFLVETHIYKPYKQRVLATYQLLVSSAGILNKEGQNLQKIIAQADKQTGSPAFRREPMAFEFKSTHKDSVLVDFLGWKKITVKSDLSGGDWTKHDYTQPVTVHAPLYTSYEPTIEVNLPEAYLLTPQWLDVIQLLDLHGITYRRIEQPQKVKVETYRYTEAKYSGWQSEGRIPVTAKYSVQTEELPYPQGALLIDMNQPSARIAAWLLEPSAPGSLTYWGFFNSIIQAPGEFWVSLPYMEVKGREMLAKNPELKKEFEAKKVSDPAFAQNPKAILEFFYAKVRKTAESNANIHPAWRIMDRKEVESIK